jgi:hypothetical protein
MITCGLCGKSFQFGPHVYNGRYIKRWDEQICRECDNGNHDGLVIEHHPEFIERLRSKGVDLSPNGKGWLDIPPRGA